MSGISSSSGSNWISTKVTLKIFSSSSDEVWASSWVTGGPVDCEENNEVIGWLRILSKVGELVLSEVVTNGGNLDELLMVEVLKREETIIGVP